ncbi:hypothetical protein VTH06DRAFT_2183 [Thermothelomyces fergusii]
MYIHTFHTRGAGEECGSVGCVCVCVYEYGRHGVWLFLLMKSQVTNASSTDMAMTPRWVGRPVFVFFFLVPLVPVAKGES